MDNVSIHIWWSGDGNHRAFCNGHLCSCCIWMHRWAFGTSVDPYYKKFSLLIKYIFIEGNYISETSHSKLRSILITFQNSGTMLGYLIAYIIGTIFEDWRDSAMALLAVPLLGSLTMVFFPETPFWLASVGLLQDARWDYFMHLNLPGPLTSLD